MFPCHFPEISIHALNKGYHTFSGSLPYTCNGVFAKEAYNSCSTSSAITMEDLLNPCEYLIAPLYIDLGSTA